MFSGPRLLSRLMTAMYRDRISASVLSISSLHNLLQQESQVIYGVILIARMTCYILVSSVFYVFNFWMPKEPHSKGHFLENTHIFL